MSTLAMEEELEEEEEEEFGLNGKADISICRCLPALWRRESNAYLKKGVILYKLIFACSIIPIFFGFVWWSSK